MQMNCLFFFFFFLGPNFSLLYPVQWPPLQTWPLIHSLNPISRPLLSQGQTPLLQLHPPTTQPPPSRLRPLPHSPSPASPALRQWEEQGELLPPLTFLLLVLGSLLLYLAVSLMDPGYVNVQPQPQVTRGPLGAGTLPPTNRTCKAPVMVSCQDLCRALCWGHLSESS